MKSLLVLLCVYYIKGVFCIRLVDIGIPSRVERGQEVDLTCEYALDGDHLYSIKWYKDDHEFFRYVPKDSPPEQIFQCEGVNVDLIRSNQRRVVLKTVDLNSSGMYKCEASAEAPSFETVFKEREMRVVDIPKEPPMISGGQSNYHVGDLLLVECTSPPSAPAASLKWYINKNEAPDTFLIEHPPVKNSDGLETSKLGLKFRVNQQHFLNGQLSLKCTATIATDFWDQSHQALVGRRPRHDNPSPVVGFNSD